MFGFWLMLAKTYEGWYSVMANSKAGNQKVAGSSPLQKDQVIRLNYYLNTL